MKPKDLYALQGLGDPRISPDERQVAFTVSRADEESNDYKSGIFLVPVDGSAPPRELTSGEHRDVMPRWSPDGRSLAFLSDRSGDAAQLFVLPMDGGEPRQVTKVKNGVSWFAWSPDGSRFALLSTVKGKRFDEEDEGKRPPWHIDRLKFKADGGGFTLERHSHLFIVDVEGSEEPERLTKGDFNHADPTWSPDGKQLVVSANRLADWDMTVAVDLHLIDVETGKTRRLTPSDGMYSRPSWSPDGRLIACRVMPDVKTAPRNGQIAVIDIRSKKRTILTESLDRQCSPIFEQREPIWLNGDILFPVETEGNTHLYVVPASGDDPKPLITGELAVSDHDVVGSTLVHAISTATSPPELYNGDKKLTDVTADFRKSVKLVEPRTFTARSADGSEVQAWVMPPLGHQRGKKYPTLLFIHGGPFTQYRNAFFDEFQVAAGAGYSVLYCNPRGSSGYSEEWGRAIRGPISGGPGMGTVDIEDFMAVVDTALDKFDFIDQNRLGVLGGSYGGFATAWIISHTDRFKAACAERGLYNVVSCVGSSDGLWSSSSVWGGSPYDDIDAMWKMSPLAHVDQINTPLLLVHSDQDLRCPVEQAEQMFVALRLKGKEVEFIRFPQGTHDLSRGGPPMQRIYRFEAITAWFDRHLKKKSPSTRSTKKPSAKKKTRTK
jgi:dipeptidyl aminopeptidase/acylaminoacyl peptidase